MSGEKNRRKMKIVEVSGTYFEMGLQYGMACPEIKQMIQVMGQLLETDIKKVKNPAQRTGLLDAASKAGLK